MTVIIGTARRGSICEHCMIGDAVTTMKTYFDTGRIDLCQRCCKEVGRMLGAKLRDGLETEDVRKIARKEIEEAVKDLERSINSTLHQERQRVNSLIETWTQNLRATINSRTL